MKKITSLIVILIIYTTAYANPSSTIAKEVNLNNSNAVKMKLEQIVKDRQLAVQAYQRRLQKFDKAEKKYVSAIQQICVGLVPGHSELNGIWQAEIRKNRFIQLSISNNKIMGVKLKRKSNNAPLIFKSADNGYYFVCKDKKNNKLIVLERDVKQPYSINGEVLSYVYDPKKNTLTMAPLTKNGDINHDIAFIFHKL